MLLTLSAAPILVSCNDDDIKPIYSVTEYTNDQTIDNINDNIAGLRRFVEAKAQGAKVRQVTTLTDTEGCTIELSDGNTIVLRQTVGSIDNAPAAGATGAYTPIVAVAQDNGTYYWTVDGEWLLDGTGKKIEVAGARAVTPTLTMTTDGQWVLDAAVYGKTVLKAATNGTQLSAIDHVDASDLGDIKVYLTDVDEPVSMAVGGGTYQPDQPLKGALRRPIDVDHPAWFVHIDVWNYPDPIQIIELIPEDIRPYVVFNLSLSVSHDEDTGRFRIGEYGYEVVKSWLRVCGEYNVWAMAQPASGGWSNFPDVESYSQFDEEKYKMYKEFFEEYPHFLGFNYCEQFWGFDGNDPGLKSVSWKQRVQHWNELLKLTHEYGGYLVYSFCANYWSFPINPVSMIKTNPQFAETTAMYPENFVVCEKYTQSGCFYDVEAECMGVWLSGHADNYGCRFDQCAWNEQQSVYYLGKEETDFPVALGGALNMEHITLTGQTVFDGPELIWVQDFQEKGQRNVGDGYSRRSWETTPQFRNIYFDLYRKIIDGTIRLMTRDEVIDRTKVAIVNDITSGQAIEQYGLPKWFHEGIGAFDHDGGREDNHFYLRKTGRYPAIPVIANFTGNMATKFKYVYNESAITSTWSTVSAKQRELNRVFPQEYTGDIFAGRNENTWVTYNGYNSVKSGNIPFKYNTAQSMDLTLETFTSGIWREYPTRLTCYLNNFDVSGKQAHTVIKINGSTTEPNVTVTPRQEAVVKSATDWTDGVLTITIDHNGPLDLTVDNCRGMASDRLTDYKASTIAVPASPNLYHGPLQHEAEVMDFKTTSQRVTSGYGEVIRNYTGQGYINMGKNKNAALRDMFKILDAGRYTVRVRYRTETEDVNTLGLYVNGSLVDNFSLPRSGADKTVWATATLPAYLNAGENRIELKGSDTRTCDVYIDNVIIEPIQD